MFPMSFSSDRCIEQQMLRDELSPAVLDALMQHLDPLAVVEGATPDVEEPPPNTFGRTELEETMARLRLSDSLAMSALDAASQERSQAGKLPNPLPLTRLKEAAAVLTQQGVVRISGGLSTSTCDQVRAALCEQLDSAVACSLDMVPGKTHGFGNFGTGFGFGSTRMKEGRYDMFLPLDGIFRVALNELLVGADANVGVLFRELLLSCENSENGKEHNYSTEERPGERYKRDKDLNKETHGDNANATMFDWSSFTSDPGAGRQPVHPDNQWQANPPLLTALVALQDIDEEMGPTSFLLGTHSSEAAHTAFNGGAATKSELLESCTYQGAVLRKGEAVFDPRCLHCGGANTSGNKRRALLYLSFRNPHCRSDVYVPPGSMFPEGRLLSLRHDF
jgi:hypothetical protein